MRDHAAISEDFARLVRSTCVQAGFTAPAAGEACILVFDSEAWLDRAAAAATLLGAHERERAGRFSSERDRSIYRLAHAFWRVALGICMHVEAAAVPLGSRPSGQPLLHGTPLCTSLSHSGSWVAIAVAHAVTVGIDVERSPASISLANLRDSICTPAETARVKKLPEAQREAMLLKLWVRKEALLKAYGSGLLQEPISLEAWTDEAVAPAWIGDQPVCAALDLQLPAGVLGALALPLGVRLASACVFTNGTSSR